MGSSNRDNKAGDYKASVPNESTMENPSVTAIKKAHKQDRHSLAIKTISKIDAEDLADILSLLPESDRASFTDTFIQQSANKMSGDQFVAAIRTFPKSDSSNEIVFGFIKKESIKHIENGVQLEKLITATCISPQRKFLLVNPLRNKIKGRELTSIMELIPSIDFRKHLLLQLSESKEYGVEDEATLLKLCKLTSTLQNNVTAFFGNFFVWLPPRAGLPLFERYLEKYGTQYEKAVLKLAVALNTDKDSPTYESPYQILLNRNFEALLRSEEDNYYFHFPVTEKKMIRGVEVLIEIDDGKSLVLYDYFKQWNKIFRQFEMTLDVTQFPEIPWKMLSRKVQYMQKGVSITQEMDDILSFMHTCAVKSGLIKLPEISPASSGLVSCLMNTFFISTPQQTNTYEKKADKGYQA